MSSFRNYVHRHVFTDISKNVGDSSHLLWATKLPYDWLVDILGFAVVSLKNCGVARFCHGNNLVMKENIAIHNTLKGSHIPSNSKKYINSILEKKNELLGSGTRPRPRLYNSWVVKKKHNPYRPRPISHTHQYGQTHIST